MKCPSCWDTGVMRCVTDRQGRTLAGFCNCGLGRAMDREAEAASKNVCCVCGRPGAAEGCVTCAGVADFERYDATCDLPAGVLPAEFGG